MFTGLIEETGIISNIAYSSGGMELTIECSKILDSICLGDSISVNGVCQTVVDFSSKYFKTQLSNETLRVSHFDKLKKADTVNLERALSLSKRLDGHMVNGHVDCLAKCVDIKNDGFSQMISFEIDPDFKRYVVFKGCICINGISLTVSKMSDSIFTVAVIPATYKETNLCKLKVADLVNIEVDILAKYVEKMLLINDNTDRINLSFLEKNGFV